MKNCFTRSLLASVDDSNLLRFDAIIIKYDVASDLTGFDTGFVNGTVGKTLTVEILSNNAYLTTGTSGSTDYGTKKTYTPDFDAIYIKPTVANTTVEVKVSSKYNLTYLIKNTAYYNIQELNNALGLKNLVLSTKFNAQKNTGIENINLTALERANINCYLTIEDVINIMPNIISLESKLLQGDVVKLAELESLTTCLVQYAGVKGDLLELVEAYRNNPSTETGQKIFRFASGSVKFNGTSIEGTNYRLIWDATSIIARFGDALKAYTYGATAEQIAELEGQGFTVIEVD